MGHKLHHTQPHQTLQTRLTTISLQFKVSPFPATHATPLSSAHAARAPEFFSASTTYVTPKRKRRIPPIAATTIVPQPQIVNKKKSRIQQQHKSLCLHNTPRKRTKRRERALTCETKRRINNSPCTHQLCLNPGMARLVSAQR